jgi:predicted nucleotidyltransferase
MGIKTTGPSHASLADALFTSTKQRVLAILFGHPNRSFYANEIIDLANSGSGAVQRELATLAASGLLTVTRIGNQKHYQANPDSPIFDELCAITRKTVGLAEPLRQALAPLTSHIKAAFIYGSVAKGTDTAASDIDLMLISDEIDYAQVFATLGNVGTMLGREVNPTILSALEFHQRLKRKEAFLTRVLAQPRTWIIGRENDLGV